MSPTSNTPWRPADHAAATEVASATPNRADGAVGSFHFMIRITASVPVPIANVAPWTWSNRFRNCQQRAKNESAEMEAPVSAPNWLLSRVSPTPVMYPTSTGLDSIEAR